MGEGNRVTYTCLLCGRNRFTRKTPHYCAGGYRKHHIKWELNNEEMKKKIKTIHEEILSQLDSLYSVSAGRMNGGQIYISPLGLSELTRIAGGRVHPVNKDQKIASITSKYGRFDIVEQAGWQGVQFRINLNKEWESKSPTENEYSEAFMAHLYGVNEVRLKAISNLKEQAKKKEEEIRSIAEDFQKECHIMVSGTVQRSTKDVHYQDETNTWLFYKLAQLSYEIKELKK